MTGGRARSRTIFIPMIRVRILVRLLCNSATLQPISRRGMRGCWQYHRLSGASRPKTRQSTCLERYRVRHNHTVRWQTPRPLERALSLARFPWSTCSCSRALVPSARFGTSLPPPPPLFLQLSIPFLGQVPDQRALFFVRTVYTFPPSSVRWLACLRRSPLRSAATSRMTGFTPSTVALIPLSRTGPSLGEQGRERGEVGILRVRGIRKKRLASQIRPQWRSQQDAVSVQGTAARRITQQERPLALYQACIIEPVGILPLFAPTRCCICPIYRNVFACLME